MGKNGSSGVCGERRSSGIVSQPKTSRLPAARAIAQYPRLIRPTYTRVKRRKKNSVRITLPMLPLAQKKALVSVSALKKNQSLSAYRLANEHANKKNRSVQVC